MGVVSGNILVRLSMFAGRKLRAGQAGRDRAAAGQHPILAAWRVPKAPSRPGPAPRGTPPPAGHGAEPEPQFLPVRAWREGPGLTRGKYFV